MTGKYEFAVLGIADRNRNEKLNAGLIIFGDDYLDVRLPKRLDKLRAMSGALDLEALREDLQSLASIDAVARREGRSSAVDRIQYLSLISRFDVSSPGTFVAVNADAYEAGIDRLQKFLVEPETSLQKYKAKRTKLTTSVKNALRKERILARKGEG